MKEPEPKKLISLTARLNRKKDPRVVSVPLTDEQKKQALAMWQYSDCNTVAYLSKYFSTSEYRIYRVIEKHLKELEEERRQYEEHFKEDDGGIEESYESINGYLPFW